VALGGLKARLLAGAALLVVAGPALAADLSGGGSMKDAPAAPAADAWTITGYIQGTNDYIFRGISQNRRDPALQGGADVSYGLFYAGTFASNVDFGGPYTESNVAHASAEVDVYAGIKPKLGEVSFDFGVITYNYINNGTHPKPYPTYDPAYQELKAGASVTVLTDLALGGTVYYSPEYFGNTGSAVTVEGTASKPITKIQEVDLAASGTVGHTFYENATANGGIPNYDYTYGNLGVTATYKAFSVDLRWWDSDLSSKTGCDSFSVFQCGSAFAGTVKFSF